VTSATTLLIEGMVTDVSRGRVLWFASSRGFDISLIKKWEMKPSNRIAITFVDHASAVAFKLMFDLTPGEAVGSTVRVDWDDPPPPAKPQSADKHSRLFVGGLSPETTNDSLRALFSSYGDLEEASVILDKRTKLSRGFGFIAFINGYVPPAVLTDDLWLDDKNIGVRLYGPRTDKEHKYTR
jgi:RNA recognition motif-containing protein